MALIMMYDDTFYSSQCALGEDNYNCDGDAYDDDSDQLQDVCECPCHYYWHGNSGESLEEFHKENVTSKPAYRMIPIQQEED